MDLLLINTSIGFNLYGQNTPGKTRSNLQRNQRIQWFADGLNEITFKLSSPKKIYFPYKIGCGMAGGNWEKYLKMINEWANKIEAEVHILVPG